jgi:hypothetical protein
LQPDHDPGQSDKPPLVKSIRRIETEPGEAKRAQQRLEEFSEAGLVRSNGLRLTRDDMHERR